MSTEDMEWMLQQLVLGTAGGLIAGGAIGGALNSSCDPNALVGPGIAKDVSSAHDGSVLDGGGVQHDTRLPYEVDFENVGGLPAQLVEIDVPVASALEWPSFQLEAVRIGTADVTMTSTGAWTARGQATVPVDGTTAVVTVTSQFNPGTGALVVLFAGPPPSATNPSPYGDFLPPNTTPPQGEGSIRFSALPRAALPITGVIDQKPAVIKFDGHLLSPPAPKPTNEWLNEIAPPPVPPGDHMVFGNLLKVIDNAALPASRVLMLKATDLSLSGVGNLTQTGLDLYVTLGSAATVQYNLPAAYWHASPTTGAARVYKYKDTASPHGAILTASVDLRKGVVKIKGRGSSLNQSLNTLPGAVDIALVAGANRYCAHFGGTLHVVPKFLFQAKNAPVATTCVS